MHPFQLADEGKLRFDPMDHCSIKLLRILSLLSMQCNSEREIVILLSDIPATILFAAAAAESGAPLQSQTYQSIVKQVATIQQNKAVYRHLFYTDLHSPVPKALHEYGTREYIKATMENAVRLLQLSRTLQITTDVIVLVLRFINEWSDILTGVNVLDGCGSLEEPNPYVEEESELWRNSIQIINELSFDDKAQLTIAMPMSLPEENAAVCDPKLPFHEDEMAGYKSLIQREEKRRQQVSFATLDVYASSTCLGTKGVQAVISGSWSNRDATQIKANCQLL